jgi:hypothetical protein
VLDRMRDAIVARIADAAQDVTPPPPRDPSSGEAERGLALLRPKARAGRSR